MSEAERADALAADAARAPLAMAVGKLKAAFDRGDPDAEVVLTGNEAAFLYRVFIEHMAAR